jgi:catechol 2,3-dioxygenase-like lactoylglutathione lyase family enzyme
MVRTRGLAHMSIPVTDLERSREFYCHNLGMKFLSAPPRSGMVFLDAGGDCIILVKVDRPISTARVNTVHHAFIVAHDDYAQALRELRENGVQILSEEDRRGENVNGPRAYFYDPDGNTLEIIDLTSYKGDRV